MCTLSTLPKPIRERDGDSMLTLLFDEAETRGKTIGEIEEAIKLYHEEISLTPSEIIKKIMVRFNLKNDVAEKYVEEVLGPQTV